MAQPFRRRFGWQRKNSGGNVSHYRSAREHFHGHCGPELGLVAGIGGNHIDCLRRAPPRFLWIHLSARNHDRLIRLGNRRTYEEVPSAG